MASTVGAFPFELVNTGTLGAVALNNKYLFNLAPEVGKSALSQYKSNWLAENAKALNEVACVTGGFDNV